jgi:hypothetical protein
MRRGELEQKLWHSLQNLGADRHPLARNIIDNILDAADMYALTREVAYHAALAASDTPGNVQLRREEAVAETRPGRTA